MWNAVATGTPAEVRGQLSEKFKAVLAEPEKPAPAPVTVPATEPEDDADAAKESSPAPVVAAAPQDSVERAVAQGAFDLIETTLATISPERIVTVSVNADAGYAENETKRAPFHNLNLVITCR